MPPHFWVDPRGVVLEFCKAFRIFIFVILCKILRSPFQNNHLDCFVHCVRLPFIWVFQKQKGQPMAALLLLVEQDC